MAYIPTYRLYDRELHQYSNGDHYVVGFAHYDGRGLIEPGLKFELFSGTVSKKGKIFYGRKELRTYISGLVFQKNNSLIFPSCFFDRFEIRSTDGKTICPTELFDVVEHLSGKIKNENVSS